MSFELRELAPRNSRAPLMGNISCLKVLVIEDDAEAATCLIEGCREAGMEVDYACDGEAGLLLAVENSYDVIVVERTLPRRDGISTIIALRRRGIQTPVLILSVLGHVDDRVTGLRAGGDDYLPKPYVFDELLARIEVLARRKGTPDTDVIYRLGDVELNRLTHQVRRGGRAVTLLPREFRLFEYLMKNAGHVVTRSMLLENVWGYRFDPQTKVIDVQISRLRAKIQNLCGVSLIRTIRGSGFIIEKESNE